MTKNIDLAQSAGQGDALAVQLALDAGEDPTADNSYALRLAARNGHAECVKLLIPVSDPKAIDSFALLWAANNGHAQCVELLIPVSDPLANDSKALVWAAGEGMAHCLELLIPVSDPLANDSLALQSAVDNEHVACVALLLPFSNLNGVKKAGLIAQKNGRLEIFGMIASFIEAKALSESCSKANLSQQKLAPLKGRGLSL